MPGLPEAVVQVGGDDPGCALGVGEVIGMAGMRAGGRLLLLGRDASESGVVDVVVVVVVV